MKMKTMIALGALGALTMTLLACDENPEDGFMRRSRRDPAGEDAGVTDPNEPGACAVGAKHVGFANVDFAEPREQGGLGKDRRRVKPYSAMKSELERVLGQSPASLVESAAAFGDVPARWYAEPVAGAVSIYTTYSVAFTACYDTMSGAKYEAAPTEATASAECTVLAQKAWQRSPTPEETKACVDLATKALATEAIPRRRWAHACASILTSAGFTSY